MYIYGGSGVLLSGISAPPPHLVKRACGTAQVAGWGSIAWIGRHGGSCLLRYQHRLRIWGRRHGQNGFGEKRGRVRLSRLICPKVVSGMVRESGKRKSAEVFRKSVKVRESNEPKSAESSGKSIMIVAPAEDVLQSSRVAISVYVSISSCVGICFRVHTHQQKNVCVVRECSWNSWQRREHTQVDHSPRPRMEQSHCGRKRV